MSIYHPIGTIVKLELSDSLQFMIAGYLPKRGDSGVFDYFAVPFPFGLVDETKYICFNRASITEVVFEGFCDEQCKEVLTGFDELAANLKKAVAEQKNKQK